MKRWLILCWILCAMVLLSGCMSLNISTGIDKNCNVFLEYNLEFDTANMQQDMVDKLIRSLKPLANSYERNGFTVDAFYGDETDANIRIKMRFSEQMQDFEAAYAKLEELLKDPEISPFVHVNMGYEAQMHEIVMTLQADLDAKAVLDTAHLEYMTEDIRQMIAGGLETTQAQLTISLPASMVVYDGSELETAADSLYGSDEAATLSGNIAKLQVPVSLEGATQIALTTRLTLDDGKVVGKEIGDKIDELHTMSDVYAILQFFAPLLLVLCIFWILRRRQNAKKQGDAQAEDGAQEPAVEPAADAEQAEQVVVDDAAVIEASDDVQAVEAQNEGSAEQPEQETAKEQE
ncbi:hypothetical protein LJC55_00270 [Eubacteriales bacterium OttesenSCG-928-N14]|nr:hypothetical protein [Eubacteriales bacterium OttesenSCG-928-N14]